MAEGKEPRKYELAVPVEPEASTAPMSPHCAQLGRPACTRMEPLCVPS